MSNVDSDAVNEQLCVDSDAVNKQLYVSIVMQSMNNYRAGNLRCVIGKCVNGHWTMRRRIGVRAI